MKKLTNFKINNPLNAKRLESTPTIASGLNAQEGFSLLETLVALAILTITMLGPMTLASSSIRSASLSHNNIIASFLAEEAAEVVRAKRDANVYEGLADWLDVIKECKPPGEGDQCIVDVFASSPEKIIDKCAGECPKIKYDNDNGTYQYNTGNDTPFKRIVYVDVISVNKEVKVYVIVEWQERFLSVPSTIELNESLFNWK